MQLVELHTQVKLNNILLLTDFSTPSDHALPFAAGLAHRFQSKVLIAHVLPPCPQEPIPIEPMPLDFDVLRLDAQKRMDALRDSAALKDLQHEQIILEGGIANAIKRVIQKREIDLVVLGTHGRAGIKKLLLGSVAEEIFRTAPCPVFTVGPHVPAYSAERDRVAHVLFATDFSPASTRALPYAVALAQENKAELTLMHVVESSADIAVESSRLYESAISRLRALLPADAVNWCEPEFQVENGMPSDEILRAATQRHTGVVVMGVHQAARLSSRIPWAVAYSVVRRADCPVLTGRA
jgi:nucleotide-binding universal stress UspA family protein